MDATEAHARASREQPILSEDDVSDYTEGAEDADECRLEGEDAIVCITGFNVAFKGTDGPFVKGAKTRVVIQIMWEGGAGWETLESLYASFSGPEEHEFRSFCRLFKELDAGGVWNSDLAGPPVASAEEVDEWKTVADVSAAVREAVENSDVEWVHATVLDFMADAQSGGGGGL